MLGGCLARFLPRVWGIRTYSVQFYRDSFSEIIYPGVWGFRGPPGPLPQGTEQTGRTGRTWANPPRNKGRGPLGPPEKIRQIDRIRFSFCEGYAFFPGLNPRPGQHIRNKFFQHVVLECPTCAFSLRLGRICLENINVFFTTNNLQLVYPPPLTWSLS